MVDFKANKSNVHTVLQMHAVMFKGRVHHIKYKSNYNPFYCNMVILDQNCHNMIAYVNQTI